MMNKVNISDIVISVQNPQLILDRFIKSGTLLRGANGKPLRYSGGFATVFPFQVNNDKWAFRCWHNDAGNVQQRFEKLSAAISNHPIRFFSDFVYEENGIVVNVDKYPTTRMRWIEGCSIKEYVLKHIKEKDKLLSLASEFLDCCKTMHTNHYSHGDLQHGNIIVDKDGRIFLIDYDSLYHPSMGSQPDSVKGLPDYQHPGRKDIIKASECMDYFSEMVIYTSIIALSEKPELSDKYQYEASENMLFKHEDYLDFLNSAIYNDIVVLSDECRCCVEAINDYLQEKSIEQLKPIETILDSYFKEPNIVSFHCEPDGPIYKGEKVKLTWQVEDCRQLYLNDQLIGFADTSLELTVVADSNYVLRAVNFSKSVSQTLAVAVVDSPVISFTCNKNKIRKGSNETIILSWNVQNALSARITDDGNGVIVSNCLASGEIELSTDIDQKYFLDAIGLDGNRHFTKECAVSVREASSVSFRIDKHFVFPTIPVTVEWNVANAKKVWLNCLGTKVEVPHDSRQVFEAKQNAEVILTVEDEFDTKDYVEEIRMLPLPQVKLTNTTPAITNPVTIKAMVSRPSLRLSLPYFPSCKPISFAPKVVLPEVPPSVHPKYPDFVNLLDGGTTQKRRGASQLFQLSNHLFCSLTEKIKSYARK